LGTLVGGHKKDDNNFKLHLSKSQKANVAETGRNLWLASIK